MGGPAPRELLEPREQQGPQVCQERPEAQEDPVALVLLDQAASQDSQVVQVLRA